MSPDLERRIRVYPRIAIAVVGFKIFDKCTPGNLTKEIIENKNVAAAIVGGAVILGVCLIVAAAMIG